MLLVDPKYSPRLPALIAAFQQADSTNLDRHLGPILAADWENLTADWRAHCEKKFVTGGEKPW